MSGTTDHARAQARATYARLSPEQRTAKNHAQAERRKARYAVDPEYRAKQAARRKRQREQAAWERVHELYLVAVEMRGRT